MLRGHRIADWNPENASAWDAGNNVIARRNLLWSIVTAHVAFSVWSLWSVMALFMPQSVYGFSTGDKLLLGATASLVGAFARLFYPMANARLGCRDWAVLSSLLLVIPTSGAIVLLAHPGLPLWPYLLCAALNGLGAGNYSSSLANSEAFYPQRLKGFALGLTGGIANLGSAAIQAVGLVALAVAGNLAPYWVCVIYLLLLAIGALGAALFMNNLDYRIGMSDFRSILPLLDSWGISFLYLTCFGSFLGFAFAFGQVLQHNFLASGQTSAQAALHAAEIAFLGPLLGAAGRVVGGRLSDWIGGGRVTLGAVTAMVVAVVLLIAVSTHDDVARGSAGYVSGLTMIGYVVGFIVLFTLSGVGSGSVFKLIPSVFEARSSALGIGDADRLDWARVRSGALIGFAGAIGTLGGVGINVVLRQAYDSFGTATPAFWVFLLCYVVAAVLTWMRYVRRQGQGRSTSGSGSTGSSTAASGSASTTSART
jgi:NNP family nitrate/nitrite transporter-like MFS transporter